MKLLLLLQIFAISTSYSIANDSLDKNAFYQELLDKHHKQGHLNKNELEKQRLQMAKDKKWKNDFHKQVRGVASSLNFQREKIELQNPAIEISVK